MGCGLPQGMQANNIGRIAVRLSQKLPDSVTGSTIARYCASSLNAIRIAAEPCGRLGVTGRRRLGAAFVPEERLGHGAADIPGFQAHLAEITGRSDDRTAPEKP